MATGSGRRRMTGGLLWLAAAAIAWPAAAGGEILERILVKVNGEILTQTELEQRQILALRQRNVQLREEDLANDGRLRQLLAEITPDILVETIDEMLLVQRGRELGYRLTDEQFQKILENIKKENRLENEEQFQAALRQEGMTLEDLRRSIERRMLIERVQQVEVLQKLSVTEEEARAYYAAHPDEFRTPATVTLREILVAVPEAKPEEREAAEAEARARAEAVRRRVAGGEDFATVAAEVSDAPSKANGGLVGPVAVTELAPMLVQALDALQPGQVSEPVRTPRGFHIVKLESRSLAAMRPFEEVRDELAERVFEERRRAALQKYLERLRAQAIIEWKSDELRKLYEQRVAAAGRPGA
ncbi:MAG TPA: peptidylprolyl isomerase [Vicinamibacterales bacterium]|nr:peptidylprolyl isomerase [Vicinamibacterales bacterium]